MSCGPSVLVVSVVLVLRSAVAQNQDAISFPEAFGDDSLRPVGKDEVPLFSPTMCPDNEYFYPGDQPGVYICDCRPGYLFLPTDEKCYAAYEQGPCSPGDMLILPEKKVIPVCVANACYDEGKVPFTPPPNSRDKQKRYCVALHKPCNAANFKRVYGVNATTLKVECLQSPTSLLVNRLGPDEAETPVVTSAPPTKVASLTGSQRKPRPQVTPVNIAIKVANVEVNLKECYPGCKRSQRGEC